MRTKRQTYTVIAILAASITFGILQGLTTAVDATAIFLGLK